MRRGVEVFAFVLLGIGVGLGSVVAHTYAAAAHHDQRFGVWETTTILAERPTNAYKRIQIAAVGLVGLPRSEVVYLTAEEDSDGRPLDPACRYRISGRSLPARWWSLTPYDSDWELIPNPDGVYSVGSHNVRLVAGDAGAEDARFSLLLVRDASGEAELPMGEEPGTWIVLRLYHPDPGVVDDLGAVSWPTVLRESCD
jgi:hypothetical protein